MLLLLHRLLKGRYPYVIVLAAIFAASGGVLGYLATTPIYRSTGVIQYKPFLQRILYQSEESSVMPMFDSFVEAQSQLIQSHRVLDMAKQNSSWKSLSHSFTTLDAQVDFRDNLSVIKKPRSTIIFISYDDPKPDIAKNAIKTIVEAYMKLYGEVDAANNTGRNQILEQRRASLSNQLASIRSRILAIANEFGSDALTQTYDFKLTRLHELEESLSQLGMTLAGVTTSHISAETPSDPTKELAVDEIAQQDPYMRELLEHQHLLNTELKTLKARFGEHHLMVKDVATKLQIHNDDIAYYAKTYKTTNVILHHSPNQTLDANQATALNVSQLKVRAQDLQTLYDEAKTELVDLGRKKLQIDNLKLEARTVQGRLTETNNRIELLNVESSFGGRIEVLSDGDQPLVPHKDKRKILAIFGFGTGGMLGFAPFILHGLVVRRLRSSEDLLSQTSNTVLLGMLPQLPDDLNNPGQWKTAGYCVHHIRTLLQLGPVKANRRVFSITSPTSGNGKTSLTLAMGLSFATSGSKTLLIDCDFIGGGLTSRLEAIVRRRIGNILLRRGLINDEQLNHALKSADVTGKRLGEALLDLGFLSQDNLNQALTFQEHYHVGLIDALDGEDINQCTTNVGIDNLDILPIGGGGVPDVSRISPSEVNRVLQEARKRYDIVLIDTGPTPGSVETSIAASQADGVVLIVSRGDFRPSIDTTIASLKGIGAQLEGLVFNRADEQDIARLSASAYGSRKVKSTFEDNGEYIDMPPALQPDRIGPVAKAVTHTFQTKGQDDDTPLRD